MTTAERALSEDEVSAFQRDGYYHLKGALTPDEILVYKEALKGVLKTTEDHPYAKRLLKASVPGAPPTEANPHGMWAGFDLPLFDDVFFDFAFHPKIVTTVAALIGPDVNLFETSFVSKVPGFPGNYRDWHQDSEYSDPQSNESLVTVITYLDDQDGQSGGTWVAPGTHKLGPIPHQMPTEEFSSNAREVAEKARYDEIGFCPNYKAGDTLIFRARLVHKSGPNASAADRMSLAYNYCRADTVDEGQINYYIGASTPVTRAGKVYRFGDAFDQRLRAARP